MFEKSRMEGKENGRKIYNIKEGGTTTKVMAFKMYGRIRHLLVLVLLMMNDDIMDVSFFLCV